MADLTIHDVPQEELDALASRAVRHGRSTEDEVRHLLHEAAAEEHLLQQLEQARRAEEAVKQAETQPPATTAAPTGTRRRYRVEPTPRRR